MCHAHARPCLSTGWALNRLFGLTSGTAAVLAQRGGGSFFQHVARCTRSARNPPLRVLVSAQRVVTPGPFVSARRLDFSEAGTLGSWAHRAPPVVLFHADPPVGRSYPTSRCGVPGLSVFLSAASPPSPLRNDPPAPQATADFSGAACSHRNPVGRVLAALKLPRSPSVPCIGRNQKAPGKELGGKFFGLYLVSSRERRPYSPVFIHW